MDGEQYAEIRGQLMANEKEHQSYNRRLADHDAHLQKLDETYVLLERLTNSVNGLAASVGDMKTTLQNVDRRVAEIEREPGDKWKKVTWEIIKAVVLAAVGVIIGLVAKGA